MADKRAGLLYEIQRDLLDGKPLADLLRKCIVLGGRANSAELRDWASSELKGFAGKADVPPYRTVPASLALNAVVGVNQITGQRIAPRDLPRDLIEDPDIIKEEVTIRQGIAEVETMGHGEEFLNLTFGGAHEIVAYMNHTSKEPFQQITALYYRVSATSLLGIVDQVRTVLAELLSELEITVPDSQPEPNQQQAANAVNVAVYGRKSQVGVTSASASDNSTASVTNTPAEKPKKAGWWTVGKGIGAAAVGLATIAATYIAYVQWH